MTEQQFKINLVEYNKIRRQRLIRSIPIIGLGALSIGVICYFLVVGQNEGDMMSRPGFPNPLLVFAPVMLLVIAVSIYQGQQRLKRLIQSYRLTITDDAVIREQANTPTLRIAFSEIKSITKYHNHWLLIKGAKVTDRIGIPGQMSAAEPPDALGRPATGGEDPAQIEALLSRVKPITFKDARLKSIIFFWSKFIIIFGALASLLLVSNKPISITAGGVLSLMLLWAFYKTQRSKNIDRQTKRSYWAILLAVAAIILVVISKLLYD